MPVGHKINAIINWTNYTNISKNERSLYGPDGESRTLPISTRPLSLYSTQAYSKIEVACPRGAENLMCYNPLRRIKKEFTGIISVPKGPMHGDYLSGTTMSGLNRIYVLSM